MAEEAQSRVQSAVKTFVNDVDKNHLRTLVRYSTRLILLAHIHRDLLSLFFLLVLFLIGKVPIEDLR